MDENTQTWAEGIQAEAERLTLKRIKEDKEERERLAAEQTKVEASTFDNKKKA